MSVQLNIYEELDRKTLAAGSMIWPRGNAGWGWIAHAGAGSEEQCALGFVAQDLGGRTVALATAHQAERELVVAVYGSHPAGICPRCLHEHGGVCDRSPVVAR